MALHRRGVVLQGGVRIAVITTDLDVPASTVPDGGEETDPEA
ncbi:MAG TPA: hypothetical protein VMZ00_12550 [Sporichthya sp.]|nr:hypothetical protein [Sporichthya sp.]